MRIYRVILAVAVALGVILFTYFGQQEKAETSTQPGVSGVDYLNLPDRSDDLPYSNLVVAGDTVYLAGSIGVDPETGAPPASIEEEVRIVLDGMKQRLAMVGLTMDDLVSVQVFCPDLSLYDQFNAIYRTYFVEHFPARAFIGSGPLLRGGHFEIIGTAVRPLRIGPGPRS